MNAIEMATNQIIIDEGFVPYVYKDTLGIYTIGHGLTYITEEESKNIVKQRINESYEFINKELDKRNISLDEFRKSILLNMCFQLGHSGVLAFKDMWQSLGNMDYDGAANAMLDSLWHEQTKNRCERLAKWMRDGYFDT